MVEHESLQEELAELRRERWQLQQYEELEKVKAMERELDEELARMAKQLEAAKQTERTFAQAKQDLLNELQELTFLEEGDENAIGEDVYDFPCLQDKQLN